MTKVYDISGGDAANRNAIYILGAYAAIELKAYVPDIVTLAKEHAYPEPPIAVTKDIGRGDNAKAIFIGKEIEMKDRFCI